MVERGVAFIRENPIFAQLVRFAIAGGISTVIYAAVYYPLVTWVFRERAQAVYAVPFAFAVAVTAGFVLHSRWSFRGHGRRDPGGVQQAKFVFVQGVGLAMNAAITWGWTALLGWSSLTALIPVVTITPLVTFALNRAWVFGGKAHG
ncbi:GtrA family protein [Sphingomonas sp.]|uniref:GtrA family protein n=1 Tax=Sphingomonas sp. TaxID=28214 RepID=UPI001DB4E4DF|nr:GtrA family protein [Sphingomonas sp.]MBX9795854.1 GtrA family protein [Sphingomonas sp.]